MPVSGSPFAGVVDVIAGRALVPFRDAAVGDLLPVDQLPECRQEIGTAVAVVDVIGVLPNVDSHHRTQSVGHRVAGVRLGDDRQFPGLVHRQPHPSGAEQPHGGLGELLLESLHRTERLGELGGQFSGHRLLRGGVSIWKKKVWFQAWAALLKTPPSALRTISSSDISS